MTLQPTGFFLLVHPRARDRFPQKWRKLLDDLRAARIPFSMVETRDATDVVVQTRQALESGFRTIVAIGGDGMLSLCARGFMKEGRNLFPEAGLLALPFGTGNDFFRGFVPVDQQKDLGWITGPLEGIALSLGTFRGREGRLHYFLNSFSLGVTTGIIEDYNRSFFRSYLLSTLKMIFRFRSLDMGIPPRPGRKTLLLLVSKGAFVGGGMRFHRQASHDGNRGKVIWIPRFAVVPVLRHIFKLYRGGIDAVPGVESFDFAPFSLQLPQGTYFAEADGELQPVASDLDIGLIPEAIRLLRPETQNA